MNRSDVGTRIAALRKERGLTMRELAERTGLSQGQISRLERGRRGLRADTLLRIAGALEVEPYRLLLPSEGEERGPRAPELDEALLRALRDPEFVSLSAEIARAFHESPGTFRAIESLVRAVLGR